MAKVVLVVDDSASLRTVVKMALTSAGYEVREAGNGQEALNILNETALINLIVSDVNMPVMNGLEFAQKVKAMDIHKFTPILMLTTESTDDKKDIAKAAGVKAWMTKPFAPTALVSAANKLAK
jgi:two-component system, chemotaxis family, chemotaxis protein CheY